MYRWSAGTDMHFFGALWMNGYPAIPECKMEVVFVRCRQPVVACTHNKLPKFGINHLCHPDYRHGEAGFDINQIEHSDVIALLFIHATLDTTNET